MTYLVREIVERNPPVVCIEKNRKIREALEIMVGNDYSQMPVIDDQGNLCGIISERSIIRSQALVGNFSLLDLLVDHCRENAHTLSPQSSIYEALSQLQTNYAVIVVSEGKPKGIITNYDAVNFFREVSEDNLYIQDVELLLRQYIEAALPSPELFNRLLIGEFGADKRDPGHPNREYEEFSFYDHTRLMKNDEVWPRFKGALEPKGMFLEYMDQVRRMRNQLAHLRGRLDNLQHNNLATILMWLNNRPRPEVHRVVTPKVDQIPVITKSQNESSPEDALEGLNSWLNKQAPSTQAIQLQFEAVEKLIGWPLQDTAYKHLSWWSNDPFESEHADAWLKAGWKVKEVDIDGKIVVFERSKHVLMQMFFLDVLNGLKSARPGVVKAEKVKPQNWWTFSAGRAGFGFGWVFPTAPEFRVELYIDTGVRKDNKSAFDQLYNMREEIEREIGSALDWDRLNNRKGVRVSLSMPGRVTDPAEKLEVMKQWGVENTLKFMDTFQPLIKGLQL